MTGTLDVLAASWDVVIFLVTVSILTIFCTIRTLRRASINYAAITAYTVLAGGLICGIRLLRVDLREYGSVSAFTRELATFGDNAYAHARLQEWNAELSSFKSGQIVTGGTTETMDELARAFEACSGGREIVVINAGPVMDLDVSARLRAAEDAALLRGVKLTHIVLTTKPLSSSPDGETLTTAGAWPGSSYALSYDDASTLSSFRRYGGSTIFSFDNSWFAEIQVLSSGNPASLHGRFGWGNEWNVVSNMVHDVGALAAHSRESTPRR